MADKRTYHIIIGSKAYFDSQVNKLEEKIDDERKDYIIDNFLEQVRLSDEKKYRGLSFSEEEKAIKMLLKNDNYHGIVESAHDRLNSLIEELTAEDAIIYIHNPPRMLEINLKSLFDRGLIDLTREKEEYPITLQPESFKDNIKEISNNIYGQNNAINEMSKSLWYLTNVNRKKPYVVLLYGGSSLGKSELAREVANKFFNGKFVSKHLSMFKNEAYSYYFFGDRPNLRCLGFDLLERESNYIFFDELDKCPDFFYSAFYTLFDNTVFSDKTYEVDISGLMIVLTSNYNSIHEIKESVGLPIFYRIDKFIHFKSFTEKDIYDIAMNEIKIQVKECNGLISIEDVYEKVCPEIKTTSENARTIKNKVLTTIEDMLFQSIEGKNKP